jgi:undecaprenyl-phosphate 4-deoxy-4-formamido-L-arabinose transferase
MKTVSGVTIVVPVFNNAATLVELCRRVRVALADRPLEIVLVDDRSTDHSASVIAHLDVVCVSHPDNRGQNAAILTGLRRATHETACVLDADLQDRPEDIPRLLAPLLAGQAHVAFASRGDARRTSSRLFRWLLTRLFPSLPEHACLWFAIDGTARAALLAAARDEDYLPAVIGALGLSCVQVDTTRDARPAAAGPSAYGRLKRLRYAGHAIGAALRARLRVARAATASSTR